MQRSAAGVDVIFDRWHCRPGDSITDFIERIERADWVIAVGTPAYRHKHDDQRNDAVVRAEQKLIKTRLRKRAAVASTVVPVLLERQPTSAFPALFEDQVHVDVREPARYAEQLESLAVRLLGILEYHPGLSIDAMP